MRLHLARIVPFVLCLLAVPTLHAQQAPASTVTAVPWLVRITGTFVPADGFLAAPVETLTLAVYADETGGTPLWQETQDVAVAADGRYAVLLGATLPEGMPREVFAAGTARWLARRFVRPGEAEPARALLTSVPYALKAADADTFGGRPPSAYVLADPGARAGEDATSPSVTSTAPSEPVVHALTACTKNFVAKFINDTDLCDSALYDAGGVVGVNTTSPFDVVHARFTNTVGTMAGYAVQNLGNTATSYSGMLFYDQNNALGLFQGFNNVTHEYRINNVASNGTINFMIGGTSRLLVRNDGYVEIPGSILKSGQLFLHSENENTSVGGGALSLSSISTGHGNSAFGMTALFQNTTGYYNSAFGQDALFRNVSGTGNSAFGAEALLYNTTGSHNSALGRYALFSNASGVDNTAIGAASMYANTTGSGNSAIGVGALESNTTGGENTAVGDYALGRNVTGRNNIAIGGSAGALILGSDNITIGGAVYGDATDNGTIRIGKLDRPFQHSRFFAAGIRGITTGVADSVPVVIDSSGQLGTINSSRRYKEDIQDMGDASSGLMKLRPVTYRYQQPYADGSKPIDYGLIAEEVEEVYPDLVAHLANGEVETVQYQKVNAMLLNEVQKQHRTIEDLTARLEALERLLAPAQK